MLSNMMQIVVKQILNDLLNVLYIGEEFLVFINLFVVKVLQFLYQGDLLIRQPN